MFSRLHWVGILWTRIICTAISFLQLRGVSSSKTMEVRKRKSVVMCEFEEGYTRKLIIFLIYLNIFPNFCLNR